MRTQTQADLTHTPRLHSSFLHQLFKIPVLLLLAFQANILWAAPAEEENPELGDLPPGLEAVYVSGSTEIERIDPAIAFDWGTGSPDAQLATGPFSANWSSLLLVRAQGKHRFHAYVSGQVKVLLDGNVVLEAATQKPQWVSGEAFDLNFGERDLQVEYKKTNEHATIKLFWSSDRFPIEPVSTHLLYRDEGRPELFTVEQGRLAAKAARCSRCHDELSQGENIPAPSLEHAAIGLEPKFIVSLLTGKQAHRNMPQFKISEGQANRIAAYLTRTGKKHPKLKTAPKSKGEKDVAEGEKLSRSLGCLACHQIGDLGQVITFGGGKLDEIGAKRSADWLSEWLQNPEKLNADHRMPVMTISSTERRQLVAYLTQLGVRQQTSGEIEKLLKDEQAIAEGKELIQQFRCAACHSIDGVKTPAQVKIQNWENASSKCLAPADASPQAQVPHYGQLDATSIQAWAKTLTAEERSEWSPYEQGRDLLVVKNCTACHPRDRDVGLAAIAGKVSQVDSRFAGQSQELIPPHLTAVGDRLETEALRKGIAGQLPKRLTWLSVRMPQFKHTKQDEASLIQYLVGSDRLPDPIPDKRLELADLDLSESEEQLVGRELVGGRAFNCIACHQFGSYEPRNTAPGTRGSDLIGVGSRLRLPYFLRWTASPLRIVPGMEMPSYHDPKPGFPVNTAHEQLSVVWNSINRPDFKPPANPAVLEQYLVIQPGEEPEVVRDVFERTGTKERVFVARPLAVGFENGHSVLFDLDRAAVREWTYGDFAAQKTEGKSWMWNMVGAPVVPEFTHSSDWALQATTARRGGSNKVEPTPQEFRVARLRSHHASGNHLDIEYEVAFSIADQTHWLKVKERWAPISTDSTSGWERQIEVQGVPDGYQPVIRQTVAEGGVGEPRIEASGESKSLPAELEFLLDEKSANTRFELTVRYETNLTNRPTTNIAGKPELISEQASVAGTPGFKSARLPLSKKIMPTSIKRGPDGALYFTSLQGKLYSARDTNEDGVEDQLETVAIGLSAPFGIEVEGNSLLVAQKPEILRIQNLTNGEQIYNVAADGWGHTDNYHDWVSGFAKDEKGELFIATGSDYAQPKRPLELAQYRGHVLQMGDDGNLKPVAGSLRYPMGIASDSRGRIFTTDQQGVQNCFNEINHIRPNQQYGVPGLRTTEEEAKDPQRAAIQIPHPWTRSVNGLFFIPENKPLGGLTPFAGHGIGCEYNHRFLVRFSLQEVDGELQGACYALTVPLDEQPEGAPTLLGPMSGYFDDSSGAIYIGSIHDSGWLGGQNTGELVRLEAETSLPNGIRELRATPDGFEVELIHPLAKDQSLKAEDLNVLGYTRVWEGGYATPDSGRYRPELGTLSISEDRKRIKIPVEELRESYLYEVHLPTTMGLFPSSGYYTMNHIPK